jgi:hypothetical protein
MKSVFYLCLNNNLYNVGFVFPEELEENFYSPGFLVIESLDKLINKAEKFYNEYMLLAVEEGKIIKTILKQKENNIFVVNLEKFGDIFFEAIRVPSSINKYVGNRNIFENKRNNNFYSLKCTDIQMLEYICQKYDFYFVGSTEVNK